MTRKKEGRLNLRMDAALLERMKEYAARRRITLTTLVEAHFAALLAEEERVVDAEQI